MTETDVPLADARKRLLRELFEGGVNDLDALAAIQTVPRERFIPEAQRESAYENIPLTIGYGQTISQPLIVAKMTAALAPTKELRVLEVGTGSGYQTAILAKLAGKIYTVERFPELSEQAKRVVSELGFDNVEYRVGDGTLGWPEEAPFDRILATAAGPKVPAALEKQLADGGRLVMPIQDADDESQRLYLFTKSQGELEPTFLAGCRFVPLVGEQGYDSDAAVSE